MVPLLVLFIGTFILPGSGRWNPCRAQTHPGRMFSTAQWLEDLDFVIAQLQAHHPHLYYRISPADVDALVAESRAEIRRARSDEAAYFAIRRVIAGVHDGHTQLWDNGAFRMSDLRFPFRLARFTDGVFITVIAQAYQSALGARVTAVNATPIDTVLAIAASTEGVDSPLARGRPSLTGITFARILYGLGLAANVDRVVLDVTLRDGQRTTLTLDAIADTNSIGWVNRVNEGPTVGEYVSAATMLGRRTPLHLRRQGPDLAYYWFEAVPGERALYVQLNQVGDEPGGPETLPQFTDRLWSYVDAHADAVDKLVIDLRYNDGGNAREIIPFVNEIIRHDALNRRGRLFVLVGERTYSAAVIFLTELVVHTNAIVLGDPPACPFNLFSDALSRGRLPNSGFELMVASRQIDNAWSPDTVYYPPDIPAPFSSQDYFAGRDPALEIALRGDTRTLLDIAAEDGADSAVAHYARQRTAYVDLPWWRGWDDRALERQINQRGYALLGTTDLPAAFEVFRLNTLLFPESSNAWDSLGEVLYYQGEYARSLAAYRKSVELDPQNDNGRQWIARIEREQQHR